MWLMKKLWITQVTSTLFLLDNIGLYISNQKDTGNEGNTGQVLTLIRWSNRPVATCFIHPSFQILLKFYLLGKVFFDYPY